MKSILEIIKNGINLVDAIFYRFKYSQIRTTKETIVSSINYKMIHLL